MDTNKSKWSDEYVEQKIRETMKILDIKHFPTHSEMEKALGNKGLPVHLSKSEGTVFWANKLGIPIKESETSFGNKYEVKAVKDIYENTGLKSISMKPRYPYDILTDDSIKIDVKVSRIFKREPCPTYSFNLEKTNPTCDIFILYCLNDDETNKKVLIIPSCKLCGQTQVGVGVDNSVWNVFIDKWNYISEYSYFFRKYK